MLVCFKNDQVSATSISISNFESGLAEECPTLTNMLVIIVGGIPIAMPTVLSVTLALGAYKLARVRSYGKFWMHSHISSKLS